MSLNKKLTNALNKLTRASNQERVKGSCVVITDGVDYRVLDLPDPCKKVIDLLTKPKAKKVAKKKVK
jgi:hypothetical protein